MASLTRDDDFDQLTQALMVSTPLFYNTFPTEKKFPCTFCDYSSNFNSNLKRHILLKHPVIKSSVNENSQDKCDSFPLKKEYACTFCDYSSNLASNLKRHLLRHSGEKLPPSEPDADNNGPSALQRSIIADMTPKKFTCDLCDYASNFSSNLKRHMLRHKVEKQLQFEVECDGNPGINKQMELQKFKNPTESSYICTVCAYASPYFANLKTHMRIHAKKKKLAHRSVRNEKLNNLTFPTVENNSLKQQEMFKCSFCSYSTSFSADLTSHIKTIHSNKSSEDSSKIDNKTNLTIENYTCNLCNFSTKTLENFNVHLLTHSPGKFTEEERSYLNIPSEACFCLLCDCSCNSKAILRKHLEAVHDIKSSECGIFDSDINDEIITLQNLNQVSCDLESQSEVSKLPKKEHEILDSSNTKKTCEDEKQLYSPSDMSLNMQNIFFSSKYFMDYSSKLKCDFCLYLTDYKINFIRHVRIHLLIDNNEKIKKIISGKHIQYRCPYCKYVILSANLYKYHLKLYHTDQKNLWNCHICNYSTISQMLFYSHSVIHKDSLGLIKYSCFSCPFKTNYFKNLKIHQVLHLKSTKKAFLCQLCSYKTSCRLLFKCHRKLHARKKFYACPHCSFKTIFSFTFQNHLKFDFCKEKNWNEYDHLEYNMNAMAYIPHTNQELNYNIHNTFNYFGDIANNANVFIQDNFQKKVDNCYKVFACKNCDYFTPYSSNLKRHIKKHSRENAKTSPEFICDVCSYSSSNRSNLKRHLKMHTGEKTTKSIICTLCDYTTCYRSNFKRHLKMHAKGFGSNQYDYTTRIKTELDVRKTTHTRFYKKCSLCDTIFTNPRAYQCHMDQAHNDKEISGTTEEEKINLKNEKELDSECKNVKSVETNSASDT